MSLTWTNYYYHGCKMVIFQTPIFTSWHLLFFSLYQLGYIISSSFFSTFISWDFTLGKNSPIDWVWILTLLSGWLIHYYDLILMLILSHIWAEAAPSNWLLETFKHVFTLWATKYSRLICTSLPSPGIRHFSEEPSFLLVGTGQYLKTEKDPASFLWYSNQARIW